MNALRLPFAHVCLVLMCGLAAPMAFAADPVRFARIEIAEGMVNIVDAKGQSRAARVGEAIYAGETVRTARGAELQARTEDSGLLVFRPDSEVRIDAYLASGRKDDTIAMSLLRGALRSVTGWIARANNANYRLRTPVATVGVRGTDHETHYVPPPAAGEAAPSAPPGVYDKVNSGATVLENAAGKLVINAGQTAHAAHDARSAPRVVDRTPAIFRRGNNEERIEARKMELAREIETRMRERLPEGKELPDADKLKDLKELKESKDATSAKDTVDAKAVRERAADRIEKAETPDAKKRAASEVRRRKPPER
jgi:hypothetical protein